MYNKIIVVLLFTLIAGVSSGQSVDKTKDTTFEIARDTSLDASNEERISSVKSKDVFVSDKPEKDNFTSRLMPKASYRRVGKPSVFVPKGQWIAGLTVSYSENSSDEYKFLVLDNITASGYNVKTTAYFGYALYNDLVLGLKAGYKRSLTDLDNLDLSISEDLNMAVQDLYSLSHSFVGTLFMRNYISLFNSKRFGIFNDLELTVERGQGKTITGTGEGLSGTYDEITSFHLGIAPGLCVFINDYAAFEVSVGVLGFDSKWVEQTTDQITTGKYHKSSANFKVDLFALKLGATFYFNHKKITGGSNHE